MCLIIANRFETLYYLNVKQLHLKESVSLPRDVVSIRITAMLITANTTYWKFIVLHIALLSTLLHVLHIALLSTLIHVLHIALRSTLIHVLHIELLST